MKSLLRKFVNRVTDEYKFIYFFSTGINRTLLSFRHWGYLHDEGWVKSFESKESIDVNEMPIPWFTYPMNHFLSNRLSNEHSVFEYGSGNSTIYFANRVKEVVSVESSEDWLVKVRQDLKDRANSSLMFKSAENDARGYVESIKSTGKRFNIIVIDGLARKEALIFCRDFLEEDGVIILDDTNSKDYGYEPIIETYIQSGFRRIDFHGMSSFVTTSKCTSILYRDGNCLGI